MPVPTYDKLMFPMLKLAEDGQDKYIYDVVEPIADFMGVSAEDRKEKMLNHKKTKLTYRAFWAKTYLTKAGLIEVTGRGKFKITERGLQELASGISDLTKEYLTKYPEFAEFVRPNRSNGEPQEIADDSGATPIEQLENAYQIINKTLISEIQDQMSKCSPAFFEQLVVDVLVGLGYGGSVEDAGRAIGKAGDEGIDGVIKEDILGMDEIYIQAKRWQDKVGRPEIQKFAGALLGKKARKGVFITRLIFLLTQLNTHRILSIK